MRLTPSNSLRWSLLAVLVLAVPLGCGSHEGATAGVGQDGATGDLGLAFSLAPGQTINSVAYTIIGPNGFTKSGLIDVSTSPSIAATIAALPVGTGFAITLSATTADGATTCAGSASFAITAHATTAVTVLLACHEPPHTGAVLVNGAVNVCPTLDGIAATPAEIVVGGSVALSAQAHDADAAPAALSYRWSASSGTFSDATIQNPVFSCTKAGTSTVSLTVSDGDDSASCPAIGSATITCSLGSGAGGSGGSATGGSAGANGGTSGGGAGGASAGTSGGGAAGAAGSGGATGTADIAVYRVGDGSGALTSAGTPVFIDELGADGTLLRSIPMPSAATLPSHRLVASGTATSEGFITRSADGASLVLTGYDAAPGTAAVPGTLSTATPRTIALVNLAGAIDTSTALTDAASAGNPRSAASPDGTSFWFAGSTGGVRYTALGTSTSQQLSTTVVNLRQVGIFGGQVFVSDSSGSAVRLGSVGAGLPTTAGQVITNLPGLASSTGSPYGFFFADLDAATPGLDTLYVADDAAGITKYSLAGSTWTSNGTFGSAADTYRGLTGASSGGGVTLYAVGGSGPAGGGQLVRIADGAGFGGAFAPSKATLASAATNTAFRGVALTPNH